MQIAPFGRCPPGLAGGCKQITMRPVDAAGSFVGPGKAPSFGISAGAQIVGTIEHRLGGTYTLGIGYQHPGATTPPITVGGLTLNLPAEAGPTAGGLCGWPWWWIVLIVLVLLIRIWLLRRRLRRRP